ncbi:MAG: hypothetical protein ABL912_02740 [Novosphingobium sp.]
MKLTRRAALPAAGLALAFSTLALAQSSPMVGSDYVTVAAITVEPGHGREYANYLASEWRAEREFAKSQGWITSYEVLTNPHKRAGEPDVYLVNRFKTFADPAESERRNRLTQDHLKLTEAQLQAGSADRDKYRRTISVQLLRSQSFRN